MKLIKKEELVEYLNLADPKDLADCLKENFTEPNQDRHFKMLSGLYFNDKPHFNGLSNGCKAAALIYIIVRSR